MRNATALQVGGCCVAGFACPHCGRHLNLPGLAPGRRVACGYCRRVLTVPGTSPPPTAGSGLSTPPAPGPPARRSAPDLYDDDLVGAPSMGSPVAPWERAAPAPPPPPPGGFGPEDDAGTWLPPMMPDADSSGWGAAAGAWDRPSGSDALKEVSGRNFAPLILGGFWALGNHLYLYGILGLVPCLGLGGLVNLYLFFRGNELSWKTGKWRSVRVFKETQRMWLWIALVMGGVFGVIGAVALMYYVRMLTEVLNDPIFTQ